MGKKEKLNIAFFGTSDFAVGILEQLKVSAPQFLPNLIITTPNKPAGRKLKLTSPPTKNWADENNIFTLQPEKLDDKFIAEIKNYSSSPWDLFIVAAYGKIITPQIFNLPQHQTINIHPSLLPKFRGSTPIHSAILSGEQTTGISIILLDKQMDHGPIIAQEKFPLWINSLSELPTETDLEKQLSQLGGKMLEKVVPKWVNKEIVATEQDHSQATFTQKLKADDSLINLDEKADVNFKKIQAFSNWPKAHFFKKEKRIIIKKAHLEKDKLVIDKVLVEGGQEINYSNLIK